MLTTLRIEHYAIVKHLELDFSSGMTAFTGETGAGKSIMIDALLLALGGRTDASVIRPGEEKCDITAGFTFDKGSEVMAWLLEHEIPCEEDQEVYLRRVIASEGRSKSYINGHPFPLQKVKELSDLLVHIHGQHQHQTLMDPTTHRQQLDGYANNHEVLTVVAGLYKQYQQTTRMIEQLHNNGQQDDAMQLLEFQLDELASLNLQDGEVHALHEEHQLLHHANEYLVCCQQIDTLLQGEEQPNICSSIHHTLQLLSQLPQEQANVKNALHLIEAAVIQCEEAVGEVQQFADRIPLNAERLQEVEERISAIHHIARKYHVDANHLPDHTKVLQEKLDAMRSMQGQLTELKEKQQDLLEQYQVAALKLRDCRKAYAVQLAKEITACIQQLGMPKGWVTVEMSAVDKIQAHGQDKVEYKICTNPGMAPDSLHKIASGGELSRVGLAIQMTTAQSGATPTLLFDEVDVGIGGATAALVGQMLRQLGERIQVFCVTHQPQVAASAHHHFRVEKHSTHEQTFTCIVPLTLSDKVEEIARMLGGLTVTEQTKLHAKELLALESM